MKIGLKILIALSCLSGPAMSQERNPSTLEVNEFLKRYFTILYIAQPNLDSPKIQRMDPDLIYKSTGPVFGTKSDNKMDSSARLLLDLFKEFKAHKKGDSYLQYNMYQAMQISGKPVELVFINDETEPVDPEKATRWNTYLDKDAGGNHHIHPGIFAPTDAYKNIATIIVGENWIRRSLREFKENLVFLVTRACTRDFGSLGKIYPYTVDISAPGETGNKISFVIPSLDGRATINKAIAFGYTFMYSSHRETRYRNLLNNWMSKQPFISIPTPSQAEMIIWNSKDPIPRDRTISYQFKNENIVAHGSLPGNDGSDWKLYSLFRLPQKLMLQNEMVLGLICKEFMKKTGKKEFNECIKWNNNRLFEPSEVNKTAMLIENLCMGLLQGRTLEQALSSSSNDYRYLFGLALVDLFAEFPDDDDESKFTASDIERFKNLLGGTVSVKLLERYFQVRKVILVDPHLDPRFNPSFRVIKDGFNDTPVGEGSSWSKKIESLWFILYKE